MPEDIWFIGLKSKLCKNAVWVNTKTYLSIVLKTVLVCKAVFDNETLSGDRAPLLFCLTLLLKILSDFPEKYFEAKLDA